MSGRVSSNSRGFTVGELLATVSIIGILTALGIPVFVNFLQATSARGAAQELATLLHQARQLAIARNTSYRAEVDVSGNRLRLVRTSDSTPWTEVGTDSQGYRQLQNQTRLTTASANPTFNPLGTAGGGTITVQDAQGTSTLSVVVSPSGRIQVQ